jgi:hypothetical protein
VTFVARQCSTYTDIMANRARNNIQESLRDLGKDSVYPSGSAQPVDPSIETPNNPNCTPLVDWRLTLGGSPSAAKVDNLTVLSTTFPTEIVTQQSTPLLDSKGNQVDSETIPGAVTIGLTGDQAGEAFSPNSLYAQGGTPTAPLNGMDSQYGYGALRCSIDNQNGDNVDYIYWSGGATHAYCYYYAVTSPPPPATIVVRKQLGGGATDAVTFPFQGNLSYNNSPYQGAFDITTSNNGGGQVSFVRGASQPGGQEWNFTSFR